MIDIGTGVVVELQKGLTTSSSKKRQTNHAPRFLPVEAFDRDETEGADWADFRRIEIDTFREIKDEDEARSILRRNPGNSAAHKFLGLQSLRRADHGKANKVQAVIEVAKRHLIAALNLPAGSGQPLTKRSLQDPQTSQNAELSYLLGWACFLQGFPNDAYTAFVHALHCDAESTIAWNSLGILYYHARQHSSSLEALSRAIRLNPFTPEPWYNLFILVSYFLATTFSSQTKNFMLTRDKYASCNQFEDARAALSRYFELGPQTDQAESWADDSRQLLELPTWDHHDVQRFNHMVQRKLEQRPEVFTREDSGRGRDINFRIRPILPREDTFKPRGPYSVF